MSFPRSPVAQFYTIQSVVLGLLSLAVIASAMVLVYTRHQSRELHMVLQKMQQQRDKLHAEWTQLLLEQSTWASDIRVEKIAREQLNMLIPLPNQMVVMKP
jgi:cell division protein FtsL